MKLISEIKKKGHRVTKSRELICQILESSGHAHFTVDELYKKVTKKSMEVDLATVYRTLELLGAFFGLYIFTSNRGVVIDDHNFSSSKFTIIEFYSDY